MGTRLGGDGALLRRDTPEHDTENHVTENRPLLHGIRFDAALYGSNGKIIAVWDLKTGSAVLTPARIQIMQNALDPSAIGREIR